MKGAVAFVLTVLMVATPATQVLAQTPQQQDVPAPQDVPLAQPVTLGVTLEQSLAPELPALPMTNPLDALLPAPNVALAVALNPGADVLAPAPMSKPGKVVLIVVGVVGAIVIMGLLARARAHPHPDLE